MEIEKAFAEERAVWWTLEERGPRSANASPRGSLTGARALRRGDFASMRSVSGTERGSNPTSSKHGRCSLVNFNAIPSKACSTFVKVVILPYIIIKYETDMKCIHKSIQSLILYS